MSTMTRPHGGPSGLPDTARNDEERAAAWLAAEAQRLGVVLDAAAHERLGCYGALIAAGAARAGLTSVRDPLGIARRHLGESLALLAALREASLLAPGAPARVVDIGSGAGLPGLAMRIAEPALRLTLVESSARRCAFLRETAAELGLDEVRVVQARAEEAGHYPELREHFDLAVARAVAPLAVLVEYALPLLAAGGLLAAPKGSRAAAELEAARPAIAGLGGEPAAPLALPLPPDSPLQQVLLVRRAGELPTHLPRRPGVPARRPLGAPRRTAAGGAAESDEAR
jgi:16S rRNA (guanine527-N7)-methyltransferase